MGGNSLACYLLSFPILPLDFLQRLLKKKENVNNRQQVGKSPVLPESKLSLLNGGILEQSKNETDECCLTFANLNKFDLIEPSMSCYIPVKTDSR